MLIFLGGKRYKRWILAGSLLIVLAALLLTVFVTTQNPVQAGIVGGPYNVTYNVLDQWDNGYYVEVTITNSGTTPISNWTISWQLTQNEKRLANTWGAKCSLNSGRISCTGSSTIRANNGTVKFGTDLYGSGKITSPATFTVNGVTVSTQPSTTPEAAITKAATAIAPTATATRAAVPSATTTNTAAPTATATRTPAPTATSAPVSSTPPPATPTTTAAPAAGAWWKPTPDKPIHWHWQLSDEFAYPRDVLPNVEVYDIDGEYATADTVAKLHALGPDVKVICYIDAGVYETYRSDAARFPQSVIGNTDTGWDGSYWLDIRQTDILLPIMRDRMQNWCKNKGFDAVEPDETEVWSNNSGFSITKAQNNYYNQKIAEMAHSLGLSVGLKGNTTEAPDLWPYFDWTLNEQCWQYNECDFLKTSFIDHGKAVFNIEYNVNPNCTQANSWHMNSARRDLNLVGPTNSAYRYSPCIVDSKNTW